MSIQITRSGAITSLSPDDLARLRDDFNSRNCVLLPRLLEAGLLQRLQRELHCSDYYERTHGGIGVELCLEPGKTTAMLEFMANDPRLFQLIQAITGCSRIGCFEGRVYRMLPGGDHYDSWHSDVGEGRMIAMSVNLSTGVYEGGVLQISPVHSDQIIHEVANVGQGDAVIFRIAPHLMHRVTELKGRAAKTAYAGWFRSEPDYQSLLDVRLRELGVQGAPGAGA
jgi:hypothetical protein